MKLIIADPPYPTFKGAGGTKQRASRWYGDNPRSSTGRPADVHPDARRWDDDDTHRELLEYLMAEADGWAIATTPDGIQAYGTLPAAVRIMAWIKPNAQPGPHRLRSCWEAVLVFPAPGRRSSRGGRGQTDDYLVCNAPRVGFVGAKPPEWSRWVLTALCYNPATDELVDLFPGSGEVARAAGLHHEPQESTQQALDLPTSSWPRPRQEFGKICPSPYSSTPSSPIVET